MVAGPAFLFDLDGTLVDSVYQHVWRGRTRCEQTGIELSIWRIHRKIGMSGGLFANALLRETGREFDPEADRLRVPTARRTRAGPTACGHCRVPVACWSASPSRCPVGDRDQWLHRDAAPTIAVSASRRPCR